MVNFNDLLRFVFNNMYEKRKRVFLTISGIIIGIFTFTFFIFASQGLSNTISGQFSSLGVNALVVQPYGAPGGGPPNGFGGLDDTDIEKIKQVIRNYDYITPVIFHSDQYEYNRKKEVILSVSYPDEIWDELGRDLGLNIAEGRMIRPGDSSVVVVGAKAREVFDEDNPLEVGSSIKVGDKKFRVIGLIEERGDLFIDSSMLMGFEDIKDLSGQDTYSGIRINFLEGTDFELMQENIERKLNPNSKEKRIQINSPKQAIEQFNSIIGVLQMIIGFVSSIALVVGGINVMNTMYSNILERVNEISVMKALGGTNSDILYLFLIESSFLGFFGALIGFFLSYGLAELLSYLITNFAGYNVPVNFDWTFFILVMVITSLFAMLFGTYPAVRASKVNPADNLRDE